MQSIDKIILQSVNPFDNESLASGNFWREQQAQALTDDSIHQEAISQIEKVLDGIAKTYVSQTLLLYGDSGSGKSYLLGRLKRCFNNKAFFAYIGPWPDSNYIWRHILRQTVDSLVQKPEGRDESQLLLWLKGLSAFRDRGLAGWLLGERRLFIKNLKETYPFGIYNALEFFGVLYGLTNPQLYPLACDWLRGDDLSEEALKDLGVKQSIDSEDAAQKVVENFGRIAADTYPIVLCFDQLDSIPRLENGTLDLQTLFSVNSSIHNQKLKGFLIIISVITNTWNRNYKFIHSADLIDDRLKRPFVQLKPIALKQVEALWSMRLHSLHINAQPQPESTLYPLSQETIKNSFPRGKTLPRSAIIVGRELFQKYKENLHKGNSVVVLDRQLAAFKLKWKDEYQKSQNRICKLNHISAPELIKILQEVLSALNIEGIKPKLLTGKFSVYSFSFYKTLTKERIGVIWTEDASLRGFGFAMKACQKVIKSLDTLYLLRAAAIGGEKLVGTKIYRQIFQDSSHHIKPDLSSIHCLVTYHELLKSARADELVLASQVINVEKLHKLVIASKVFDDCLLLQAMQVVQKPIITAPIVTDSTNSKVKDFILDLVKTQQLLARKVLIEQSIYQFAQLKQEQIAQAIEDLCQEKKISILDPKATSEDQIICLIPG